METNREIQRPTPCMFRCDRGLRELPQLPATRRLACSVLPDPLPMKMRAASRRRAASLDLDYSFAFEWLLLMFATRLPFFRVSRTPCRAGLALDGPRELPRRLVFT